MRYELKTYGATQPIVIEADKVSIDSHCGALLIIKDRVLQAAYSRQEWISIKREGFDAP